MMRVGLNNGKCFVQSHMMGLPKVTNLQILTEIFNQFHKEKRSEQFQGTCTSPPKHHTLPKFCHHQQIL